MMHRGTTRFNGRCGGARLLHTGIAAALALVSASAGADQFHYNNVVLGERAVGLGGAFTAVADDASGAHYNPAGLAFALSNDISGSANAIYNKKIVYKDAFAGEDFTENAGGTFAPFFGILQKMDKQVPGLVAAFAYYTTDTELKDQNDFFKDKVRSERLRLDRLHRTVQQRAATTHLALAAGYRMTSTIALGGGLTYTQVSELTQEYQDVQQSTLGDPAGALAGQTVRRDVLARNLRESLEAGAIEPTIGVQMALGSSFSIGAMVRKGFYTSQKLTRDIENTQLQFGSSNAAQPVSDATPAVSQRSVAESKFDKPLGSMPAMARFGAAWFASTRFLWTFDVIYHEGSSGAEKIGAQAMYGRDPVLNFATGAEYFMVPSVPLRLGLFTNNDARPEVKEAAGTINCGNPNGANYDPFSSFCNQRDSIDYIGQSIFFAWVQPNSQIALGAVLQQGKGKAQKIGASQEVQDVTASAYSIGFSATQSF